MHTEHILLWGLGALRGQVHSTQSYFPQRIGWQLRDQQALWRAHHLTVLPCSPCALADGKHHRSPPRNMRVKFRACLRMQCVLDLAKKTICFKAVILHLFLAGQVGTYISCSSDTQPTSSPPSHAERSRPICTPGSHLPPPTPASSRLCFSAAVYPSDTCASNAQALRRREWRKGDEGDGRGAR